MKKIWVILLVAMLAVTVGATATEADQGNVDQLIGLLPYTIVDGSSYNYAYTDATNSAVSVKNGDTEIAVFTYNNGILGIQSGTLSVKTENTTLVLDEGATFSYDKTKQVITLTGNSTLSTEGVSNDRIIIAGNGTYILDGVRIKAKDAPGIDIAYQEINAVITLANGSSNIIEGGSQYAGINVGWKKGEVEPTYSNLTINGNGELKVTGGEQAAGIGGSKKNGNLAGSDAGLYGNITISSGTIIADGGTNSAGIGSADNVNNGKSNGSYKYYDQVWGVIKIDDGTITATGKGNGAGIGGGNHTDSGLIIINGGVVKANGHTGIGSGLGSSNTGGEDYYKGPGSYFATIEINGGTITAKADNGSNGAGIGGGYCCDGDVVINGGDITAIGGAGNGNYHHGGAGIGGGYLGHGKVIIRDCIRIRATGGAAAAGIGSGGAPNTSTSRGNSRRDPKCPIHLSKTSVIVSGGYVIANGGSNGGSGIGGGNGADLIEVSITGGRVVATGAPSNAIDMRGGAGIGSGYNASEISDETKYMVETNVHVEVSASANITAVGGWGAAGIGSGAKNKIANTISISGGTIEAYADGTKFAIDTRVLDGDKTTSYQNSRAATISHNILQGTFVHEYTDGGITQNPEGLSPIVITNEKTDEVKTLTRMPGGYRSFATSVSGTGTYTVYTDAASIGEGDGRYFATASRDDYNQSEKKDYDIQYQVSGGLSDNFYLYPVKSIVIKKKMARVDGAELSGVNGEISFVIQKQETKENIPERETIRIINGVPQSKAYFVNIPDGKYDIIEMNGDLPMTEGTVFSGLELRRITTNQEERDRFTVINTFGPQTITVSGTKTWVDENNQDGLRPASITVNLLADGEVVRTQTVMPDAAGIWSYSFENVPEYSNGRAIVYTVSEEPVAGYTATVSGMNLVNTHIPETTDLSGTKTWADENNQDGLRPASITVNLLADGAVVRTQTVMPDASGVWSYSFTNLPVYSDGRAIVYTVSEEPVAGYTAEVSGMNLINTHIPETVNITGVKTWNDADNQDGIRPAFITVNLLADGAVVRTTRVTPDASGAWRYSFENLPGKSGGNPITYTVSEEPVAGYTAEASGTNLINTHVPETIDITGVKIWNDADNQDGIRPTNIRVNLLANGTQIRTATVTGTTNRWNFTFEDLPRFEGGAEIAYTVTEAPVAGYTTAINGTTITNTHVPEVVTISGTKTWNDNNNEDGIRPDSITVSLLADGRKIDSRTVLGSGSYAFENLNRYERGREIRYSIEEEPVAGYTAEVSGYNLINTHVPERVEISGTKTWADHDNRDGLRPQSVTVNLMADGTQAASQTVTGEGNVWSYSFTNLPGYRNGRRIVYTVTENPVAEYETSIIGTNIYNIHQSQDAEPERYTVTIRYWADGAKAFPDYNGTYNFGEKYDVTSPAKPGYTVDKALVAGIVYENTVIDVYYTPNTVKLSVFYQYLDGSTAADPHFETLHAGDRYSVVSPVIEGYTASIAVVEGTMPGQDLQVIVWYRPDTAEENEGRVPLGDGTTMITEYGVPLGLGDTNRNAGECYD